MQVAFSARIFQSPNHGLNKKTYLVLLLLVGKEITVYFQ